VVFDSDEANFIKMVQKRLTGRVLQIGEDVAIALNESDQLLLLLQDLLKVLHITIRVLGFFKNLDQLLL
jgi:hypothetical protein